MTWSPEEITRAQLRLPRLTHPPRTNAEYRRSARWWELEARRGYPSAGKSLEYARNMRWCAELAGLHGPGTWLELLKRAGVQNPYAGRGTER